MDRSILQASHEVSQGDGLGCTVKTPQKVSGGARSQGNGDSVFRCIHQWGASGVSRHERSNFGDEPRIVIKMVESDFGHGSKVVRYK
jgi:hypothetical protein